MIMDKLADLGEKILKMDPMPDEFFRVLSEDEEGSFRKWSRDNYQLGDEISGVWHPMTRDECHKMNAEAGVEENVRYFEWIEWLSSTMLEVASESLFKIDYKNSANKQTFFEMVCNRACLRSDSFDVKKAFEQAIRRARA